MKMSIILSLVLAASLHVAAEGQDYPPLRGQPVIANLKKGKP